MHNQTLHRSCSFSGIVWMMTGRNLEKKSSLLENLIEREHLRYLDIEG